jgi:hypothetical protein
MGSLEPEEIQSVYDLALIVIDECSKVFFDQTKPLDQRPEVVDLFSSAISKIVRPPSSHSHGQDTDTDHCQAENKTIAYEGFGRDVSRISIDTLESAEQLLRKSLNIGFEWSILEEAQQVIDELQIMQEIFSQQISAMRDFDKHLCELLSHAVAFDKDQTDLGRQKARDRIEAMVTDMDRRRQELASMERLQTKTRSQVSVDNFPALIKRALR